ncbi:YkgJ family cysteine cluster protein [Azotobacter beijerinckii]|uniref:YkgJ family cysteine cluster protein n=1 Tax=Azotobacter beijerinckii TaxID=170623 RepID=UPI000B845B9A
MADGPRNFPCNQCGECCRRVHLLAETASLDRGDGICRHFDDDLKRCRIYQQRPDICWVDRQYELHYRSIMTWEAFVELNQSACKALQSS